MREKYLKLGIALALLVGSALGYAAFGMRLFGQYRVAYAGYRSSCDALITWSPPATIYTGLYVNQPSLLTLRYRADTVTPLDIRVGIPGFTQDQQIQVDASTSFASQAFKPPLLNAHSLDALVGPRERDAQIHLQVRRAQTVLCDTNAPTRLDSRQWMHWSDPASGDLTGYLAGWVTPQAPVIDDLVGRTATWIENHPADYAGLSGLNGYARGQGSSDDVRLQVNALFDTLQFDYHMHYAEENVPFDRDQLVRLPQDVLSQPNPTGMCVETTAILASAVERLGMRPYIVLIPGHVFLGVAVGPDPSASLEYWETSDLNGGVRGTQANVHGDAEYARAQAASHIVHIVDVATERSMGIEPIE